jgi:RHH-type transcriptional regulator, rel operon repressor / antitoxin RelB
MNHVGTAALGCPAEQSSALTNRWRDRRNYVMLNMFNMLGIRLEPELEEKLDSLAKETGRSKSYYAREAIRQYLEDREDYLKGIAALERREPTITLEELERRLGLDD